MGYRAGGVDWLISDKLAEIITTHILPGGCIINFRDPDYDPIKGGYHPVEIMIGASGDILYITDFSYVGRPPFCELDKELDFDFSSGCFTQMGRSFPINTGVGLFKMWSKNFCSYYRNGIYEVSVQEI